MRRLDDPVTESHDGARAAVVCAGYAVSQHGY